MEWFKHKTGSLDDPDFNAILDEFGSDGYMMFFGLLEIYGKEFSDINADGFLRINLAFVARKLRKSSAKVQKFLDFCQEYKSKDRWEYKTNGRILLYKVPKFIEIASNWTKRIKQTTTEATIEATTAIKKEKKKYIYSEESLEYQLSKFLLDLILERNGGFKKPNLQKWADNIRLLIDRDKKDPAEIRKVISWCQADDFWKSNILSTGKLRKQFDQLSMKMQDEPPPKPEKKYEYVLTDRKEK